MLALIISTLQILFDVPVAPFLVPSGAGNVARTELAAKYDDGVQLVSAAPEEANELETTAAPETAVPAETSEAKTTAAPAETSTPSPDVNKSPVFEKEEKEASLGGWLEGELQPNAGAEGVKEIRTWTGWIFDRDCVGINPVKHTKACNLMGSCFDSGLGIFEYIPGKAYDTYTAVETFLAFDGASKELAAAFLKALPREWKNNVTVTVTGYAVNNIPAAADEALIPETDLSRVDHYLNGIHITSIEAAYIDGLSTNPLPELNVVFTQP